MFEVRSDIMSQIHDVLDFLGGSNRLAGNSVASPSFSVSFNYTSTRIEFMQVGMPRRVADNASLPFAELSRASR